MTLVNLIKKKDSTQWHINSDELRNWFYSSTNQFHSDSMHTQVLKKMLSR